MTQQRQARLAKPQRWIKRFLDFAGSLVVLTAASPILFVSAALIRLTMGSPVLFSQRRPGLGGKPFKMLKFRTMSDRRSASGDLLSDEVRLTRLGRFLRATSIDELPELINVLRGDMSLVGPRPLLMEYLEHYTTEEARRHEVKPGITGWAQINGRNTISWEEKFRLDRWYVDNWSLALDLQILVATIGTVLRRDGISADAHATMPKFERRGAAKTDQ